MAEPETITLPKSGVVLWRRDVPREVWTQSDDHDTGPFRFAVARDMSDDIPWRASLVVVGSIGSWQDHSWGKTRDECLAWLDDRVLSIRAALLPPGAIVVRDSEETRERIARSLWDGEGYSEPWGEAAKNSHPVTYRSVLRDARAVVAALREASHG